jgi:hypothetical protein
MFMLKYIDFHSRGLSLSFSQVGKLKYQISVDYKHHVVWFVFCY